MDAPLTDLEREMLRLVAQGRQRKEIAKELGRCLQTIKNHMTLIYQKLGADNAAHAVYLAVTRGIL